MNLGYLYVMGQSHFRSFRWLTVKIVIPIKQEFYQQKYPILQGFQPLSAKIDPESDCLQGLFREIQLVSISENQFCGNIKTYSHSMVPMGLGVRSSRTRLMPSTSWVMR